jgi:hypothetical protein
MDLDRPCIDAPRQIVACIERQGEHRIVAGLASLEQVGGAEAELIVLRGELWRTGEPVAEIGRGVERQQHRDRAVADRRKDA